MGEIFSQFDLIDFELKQLVNPSIPFVFNYAETDIPENEIAELYSYSEHTELESNCRSLRTFLKDKTKFINSWFMLGTKEQSSVILMLLNQLEHKEAAKRLEASRCVLYIAQGCWGEYISFMKWFEAVHRNVILLYRHRVFHCFVQQFNLEAGKKKRQPSNMFGTEALRIILNVLYTMVEVARWDENVFAEYLRADDLTALMIDLFNMLSCMTENVVPVKKILLLIWKLLLLILGGLDACNTLKKKKRMDVNLPPDHDYDCGSLKPKPKVYQADFNKRLMLSREKHIPDLKIFNDYTTLAGLPQPEITSLNKLQSFIYVPLGDVQMEYEEKIYNHHLLYQEDIEETPAELFYSAMLPYLKHNLTVVLYILSSTNITTSFNLLNQSIKLPSCGDQNLVSVDIQRHNEILLKAISNIILLLLKHFKTNHILQFENISQILFNLEAIDLIIMLLQNNKHENFLSNTNDYPNWNFPTCVLSYDPPPSTISWRNTATTINWMRILNKLVKRKQGRLLNLFSFNIEDILTPWAKIRNDHMKLYSLKLLKMIMKYARKSWVKLNTELITDMYNLVRSQLDDHFLNSVPTPTIPSHSGVLNSKEEKSLSVKIARFHERRYKSGRKLLAQWEPSDQSCLSVLAGSNFELGENFKRYYEFWLQEEVFNK